MNVGSDRAAVSPPGSQIIPTDIRNSRRPRLLFLIRGGIPRRFLRAQEVVVAAEDDARGRGARSLVFHDGRAEVGDGKRAEVIPGIIKIQGLLLTCNVQACHAYTDHR